MGVLAAAATFLLCLIVPLIGVELSACVYRYTTEQKQSDKSIAVDNGIWASAYLVPVVSMVASMTITSSHLLPEYGIEKYPVLPITDDKDLDA